MPGRSSYYHELKRPVPGSLDPGALLEGAPPTLSRRQLLDWLAITDRTLWAWTQERGFPRPAVLSSSACRWRTRDVRAWLRAQTPGGKRKEETGAHA
jgi:predicted DNA-binding transcriptional regulator AlpA